MNVEEAANPERNELAQDVGPEAVMESMEQTARNVWRSGNTKLGRDD